MNLPGVIDRDLGYKRKLAKIKGADGATVSIGVFKGDALEYSWRHEFGTGRMPARPFMAQTDRIYRKEIIEYKRKLVQQLIDETVSLRRAMYFLGVRYQARMRATIRAASGWAVPLAPATIARKRDSRILIETQKMYDSIEYKINGVGKK